MGSEPSALTLRVGLSRAGAAIRAGGSLSTWLRDNHRDPVAAMNALQDAGIISDLCVTPEDVAEADALAAISFLSELTQTPNYEKNSPTPVTENH